MLDESRAKVTELHQAKRLANIDTGDAGDGGEGGDGKAKSKKRKKGAAAAAADEEFYVGDDAPIERVPKKKNVEVSRVVLGVGMPLWSAENVCMAGTARCDDQLMLHVVTRIQRNRIQRNRRHRLSCVVACHSCNRPNVLVQFFPPQQR